MALPHSPSLDQINNHVWVIQKSRGWGRLATQDNIPDSELDRIAELGFGWVSFLRVECASSR